MCESEGHGNNINFPCFDGVLEGLRIVSGDDKSNSKIRTLTMRVTILSLLLAVWGTSSSPSLKTCAAYTWIPVFLVACRRTLVP
jgi:hypothetical protein